MGGEGDNSNNKMKKLPGENGEAKGHSTILATLGRSDHGPNHRQRSLDARFTPTRNQPPGHALPFQFFGKFAVHFAANGFAVAQTVLHEGNIDISEFTCFCVPIGKFHAERVSVRETHAAPIVKPKNFSSNLPFSAQHNKLGFERQVLASNGC